MTPVASVEFIPGIEQNYPVIKGQLGEFQVTVWGRPYISGIRLSEIPSSSSITQLAKDLDGEWLLAADSENEFVIANDRFASIPVFYAAIDNKLYLTTQYSSLKKRLVDLGAFEIDPEAFFEFFHFQRLFGESTFDRKSKVLFPSSTLTFDKLTSLAHPLPYWKPSRSNSQRSRNGTAEELAHALKTSVAVKTEDSETVGLLLSGGMDSRVVLGALDGISNVDTYTVGNVPNNESKVAAELANIAGTGHSFVSRCDSHYESTFSQNVNTSGGMFSFQHGHFKNLEFGKSKPVVHGHGLDYYFQGMYLPSRRINWFGRPTAKYKLETPDAKNLKSNYLDSAKYRLKGVDSFSLLNKPNIAGCRERLLSDLSDVETYSEIDSAHPLDQWDHFTTYAPSRHYTYLNLLSIDEAHSQSTVTFDNRVLDIYLSTPPEIRFGTQLLAETTRVLNPRLLNVRNANTNLNPALSPTGQTLRAWQRGFMRRTGLSSSSAPSPSDRSWPSTHSILKESKVLNCRIQNLGKSENIDALQIFDLDSISRLVTAYGEGKTEYAPALMSLLTIDEFLTQ